MKRLLGILPMYGTASYGVLQGPVFLQDGGSVARDATMKKPTIPGGPGKIRGFFHPGGPRVSDSGPLRPVFFTIRAAKKR